MAARRRASASSALPTRRPKRFDGGKSVEKLLPTPAERTAQCASIIQGRKRKDPQKPAFQNTSLNICQLSLGKKAVTVPYGEHVVFAIAVRNNADFMLGCNIQTFGKGDAPLPIAMSLVDVSTPVPDTTCGSVTDFCAEKCPAN